MKNLDYKELLFDASAILALIGQEKGYELLEQFYGKLIMSTVNLAEVAKYFVDKHNRPLEEVKKILDDLVDEVIEVNKEIAYLSADLISTIKPYGLSLGDRICIATAITKKIPVITADKIWSKLDIKGLILILAR